MTWDAIVLAGGGARRLDGVAKPALPVGGRSLLARVVAALGDAERVIVVGPAVDDVAAVRTGEVVQVREEPPGGGPVAGLAAGLGQVQAPTVAVVAGDLPFLTPDAIVQLAARLNGAVVAVAIDDTQRDQYLLALWPRDVLRTALDAVGPPVGAALRTVYRDVAIRRVRLTGTPPPWWDCDTPQQLAQARAWASPL